MFGPKPVSDKRYMVRSGMNGRSTLELCAALISVEMTAPLAVHRLRLNDAAIVAGAGNDVAQ
jgi:hypothetical protein